LSPIIIISDDDGQGTMTKHRLFFTPVSVDEDPSPDLPHLRHQAGQYSPGPELSPVSVAARPFEYSSAVACYPVVFGSDLSFLAS
jgi:hypothetical protein